MPRRNSPKDAPADFDELLADQPEDSKSDEPTDETPVVEVAEDLTPAQKRLAAARAAKAAREANPEPAPAVPEEDQFAGLSQEEIDELKAIEDEEAQLNNARLVQAERAETQFDNSRRGGTGKKILFHVLRDGFTAFGDVWYRGQEIEIEVGTPAYQRTLDVNGKSWLDIIGDEAAQYLRWGDRMVAPGEFRGRPDETFDDELVGMDRRRGRTVPVVAI